MAQNYLTSTQDLRDPSPDLGLFQDQFNGKHALRLLALTLGPEPVDEVGA